jgi:hypothetical protein
MKKLLLLFALSSVVIGANAAGSGDLPALKSVDAAPEQATSGCGLRGTVRDTPGVPLVCGDDGKWIAMYTKTATDRTALIPAAYGCVIVGPDGRKLKLTAVSDSHTVAFFPKGTRFTPACLSPN